MELTKRLFNKKGVSPVISTLLLVSTVFAMFAIIYPWAFSSLTLSQSRANLWYANQEEAAKERFTIEMVVFGGNSTTYVELYVRNVGEIDIDIEDIYINGSKPTMVEPPLPEKIFLKEGGVGNCIPFNATFPWTEDETHVIKAVTSRGGEVIIEARAPS